MTSVAEELYNFAVAASERDIDFEIVNAFVPEPSIDAARDAEFGAIVLADGSVGLFYAWLGESQTGISLRYRREELLGEAPLALAALIMEDDDMARSIGLAMINAISQSVFTRAGMALVEAPSSMAGLDLGSDDRLGMVGHFPSLARRALAAGVPVAVVERKQHMLQRARNFEITDDMGILTSCNKIICTAACLLNGSVDEVLANCRHADQVSMLGPSASFVPDAVFKRGVNTIGGTQVVVPERLVSDQVEGAGLKHCARRYQIDRHSYPGATALLSRASF